MKRSILLHVLITMVGLAGTAGAAEEPAAGPPAYYTFQVMTLPAQYRANAERLLKALQAKGYPAYLVEVRDIAANELSKIRVGRFPTAAEARAAAERFSEQEGRKVLVLRSRVPSGLADGAAMPVANEGPASSVGGPAEVSGIGAPGSSPAAETGGEPGAAGPKTPVAATAAPAERRVPPPEPPKNLPWPVSVSRIFWYRAADNTVHVTNLPLPSSDPGRLERVSVFPVRYVSAGDTPGTLVLEVEGERMQIVLAGLRISAPRDRETAFYERRLREIPLRLDYEAERKTGAVAGRLSRRDGTPVNLELVRLGIAVCSPEGLGPEEQAACLAAEEEAGGLKKD